MAGFIFIKWDDLDSQAWPYLLKTFDYNPFSRSKTCRNNPFVSNSPVEREHSLLDFTLSIHDQCDRISLWIS